MTQKKVETYKGRRFSRRHVLTSYRNVYTYRQNLAKLVKRTDEFDYVFSGHFSGFIEAHVMYDILDTLNAVLEDPNGYDYKEVYKSGSGRETEKMFRKVKGFGDVAYETDSFFRRILQIRNVIRTKEENHA